MRRGRQEHPPDHVDLLPQLAQRGVDPVQGRAVTLLLFVATVITWPLVGGQLVLRSGPAEGRRVDLVRFNSPGLSYNRYIADSGREVRMLVISLLGPALLSAVLPALWLSRRYRGRRRQCLELCQS